MTLESTFNTRLLHDYLDRLRAGDREAGDCLFRGVCARLERLARRMLRGFPNVQQYADTNDVLQGALVRLLRTLQAIRPATTRDFVNLAAVHVRRELLDLARHFRTHPEVLAAVPDTGDGLVDLDRWSAFHDEVERLPAEEREVVGLTFYHGWTQVEIAGLLGVDERTVRRKWRSACRKLTERLRDELPGA